MVGEEHISCECEDRLETFYCVLSL